MHDKLQMHFAMGLLPVAPGFTYLTPPTLHL
jgi:hypothetical protein